MFSANVCFLYFWWSALELKDLRICVTDLYQILGLVDTKAGDAQQQVTAKAWWLHVWLCRAI